MPGGIIVLNITDKSSWSASQPRNLSGSEVAKTYANNYPAYSAPFISKFVLTNDERYLYCALFVGFSHVVRVVNI